jgi:hypothetical protein
MKNRTCRGCGKDFIPSTQPKHCSRISQAKHCSRECRRTGYLSAWANNPERRRIQSLETKEIWSDPKQRKRIVTSMLAAWENAERRRIQSLETAEHWSNPEQRNLRITAMLAARQIRAAAISNERNFT